MAEATLRSGDTSIVFINHTALANRAAGEVVILGNLTGITCGIAHMPITSAAVGVLSLGGIWEVVNLNNAANADKVYWDDSVSKVTTVSTNNAQFGFVVEGGGAGANTNCRVLHFPYV